MTGIRLTHNDVVDGRIIININCCVKDSGQMGEYDKVLSVFLFLIVWTKYERRPHPRILQDYLCM